MSADSERLLPPNEPAAFESLCFDLWKDIWGDPGAQKNGRSGQPQAGVDIFGQMNGEWIGVQCKQKDGLLRRKVTTSELEVEIENALKFKPKLARFANSGPRDVKIQERARQITARHRHKRLFIVEVWSWEDIPAAHDFLVDAFGFTSGGVHRTPDGQAVHAEVRAGDLVIWLHRVAADLKLSSPRSLPAASSGLVVYVEDVDAHYARARSRGAETESEPKDMPYGQREYGARDVEGHRWWFATPLK